MPDLYTTKDLAGLYGITPERVRQIARARGVGQCLGAGKRGSWVFTLEEANLMRPGKPGRRKGGE